MNRGWWRLSTEMDSEISDSDREHIAEMVNQGYTSGQLIHDDIIPECPVSGEECEDYDDCDEKSYCHLK